jgi:IS1 family transposase
MNRTSIEKRAQIIGAMVEGNSLRSIVRMTGTAMNTALKLWADVGQASLEYQNKVMRNLPCKRIQCDEIWQFCYAKEKNVPVEKAGQFGYGDVWTWVALCADTKIVPTWMIGGRDAGTAFAFMQDLAGRLSNCVQLTTDGHRAYLSAVESVFGSEIDYAMLVKMYGNDLSKESETRYSPAECIAAK